ncbi:MAG: MotA/TolQ/ExbB proton channel family protein [Candidatus Binatia bacterium]
MNELNTALEALRFGGAMVYPLLVLGALAVGIMLDRAVLFSRCLRLPQGLRDQAETYGFRWDDLEAQLQALGPRNAFGRFFQVIADNRTHPAWWVESRAGDEAGDIEKVLARGLWVLETIVTAAPLMGLLGTITGMMQSFKVIGGAGLVAPTQVTAGVAQALIATALGLLIALAALFAFNFFSRLKSRGLDEMERLGSRLVDRIRLDEETVNDTREPQRQRRAAAS